jgi:hypothetical protein
VALGTFESRRRYAADRGQKAGGSKQHAVGVRFGLPHVARAGGQSPPLPPTGAGGASR